MSKFPIGDYVSWNSEAGRVTGKIIKVHHEDSISKDISIGHRQEIPQYEIKSDKTDRIAAHKEGALTKKNDQRILPQSAIQTAASPSFSRCCAMLR
jgi:hypothetical protein